MQVKLKNRQQPLELSAASKGSAVLYLQFVYLYFWREKNGTKGTCKMLVKMTKGLGSMIMGMYTAVLLPKFTHL